MNVHLHEIKVCRMETGSKAVVKICFQVPSCPALTFLDLLFDCSHTMTQRGYKKIRLPLLYSVISFTIIQMFYRKFEVNNIANDSEWKFNAVDFLTNKYLLPPDKMKYNLSADHDLAMDTLKYGHGTRAYIKLIFSQLSKKYGGFFIEAGALDGEYLSNTLYLEYYQKWTGLLIEPDPNNFQRLKEKHRKAWISNTCLSTSSDPKNISLVSVSPTKYNQESDIDNMLLHAQTYDKDFDFQYETLLSNSKTDGSFTKSIVSAACFPLENYLTALNVTTVDVFSLDIQGGEFEVLKTIPWDRVHFRLIFVEVMRESLKNKIIEYMKSKGYLFIVQMTEDYFFYNEKDTEISALVNRVMITEKGFFFENPKTI
ncbi:unnamed protein product [Meganyctiphanes norvegica]|uniref:Methyltransferase FkbM domain-containing protein n=1 Tax=Meganyctiphanes norvegica TaxID=48144 RepID=A0AAV2PZK9_MEGNR